MWYILLFKKHKLQFSGQETQQRLIVPEIWTLCHFNFWISLGTKLDISNYTEKLT